nr:MAG TPA: Receptor recognition protein, Long tail, Helical sandwich, Tail fiber [Caudoviricetes sp.]
MYETSKKWKQNRYENPVCAMNIYIDDVLINPDYILDFKKGGNAFEEEFCLGGTPSQYIEMKLYKDKIPLMPSKIKVEYGILISHSLTVTEVNAMLVGTLNGIPVKSLSSNNSSFEMIPIGIYNVDDYTDNDDNTITIKALDNMIKFEFNYNGKELIDKRNEATLLEVAQDICNKAGVELGSTSFLNSDKKVSVYDNTVTARKYISYIAESAGCFACIDREGKLCFREFGQDEIEIPLEMFGEYKWGEEFKISKLSYEDGLRSFKFGDNTRNNLWINQENMYIVDEDQVQKIYNKIKGLTVNTFEGKVIIDPAIDIGDKIVINGKNVIYQGEMSLEGRFIAQISSKIQIKQKEETTVKKESQKVVNRRVQSRIAQAEGKIEQLVEETTENSEKLTKHEQDINGITQSVSEVKTEIKTVDGKADKAQSTANTAKSTADSTNKNLSNNYYTKTETNSQITQKAESITSEVSKTYSTKTETSTAKAEAINSANSSTDNKLKGYTETSKLGTAIEQNYEHVKVAWNQISDFIQMMIINKNASLAILDKDKNVMMALDKNGQHFYKSDGNTVFGEMGVQTVDKQNYISFAVPTDYGKSVEDGMAWGVITSSDDKFWPIMYIKNFTMPPKNSEGCTGEMVLDGCDLVLNSANAGIVATNIKMHGDAMPGLYIDDTSTGQLLLSIIPQIGNIYPSISILDKISFYVDLAGNHTLRIGEENCNCTLSDDGFIACRRLHVEGNITATGEVISNSSIKVKKNIERYQSRALDEILKTDIYMFNYKSEEESKKTIGTIIGDGYNCSKEIMSSNKEGINLYSMVSIAYKAIQEQQDEIEKLQAKDKEKDNIIQSLIKRIETLEKGVNK